MQIKKTQVSYLDINEDVQFCLKQRVFASCFHHLKKLTPLCEGFKAMH